jgi:hypothetical protein
MIKGTAPMRMKIQWNGTQDELIKLADEMSEHGLDSLDLGDSMGFFLTYAMFNDSEFEIHSGENTLKGWIEYESFQWEGIK